MNDGLLDALISKLDIFSKAFDHIRIVDPVNSKVIDLKEEKTENSTIECFNFWGKNRVCDNCISMRAYLENKTFTKIEYNLSDIYIVTAIPIEMFGRRVVVELLKNATDSISINVNDNGKYSEIYAMIDSMNNMALKDSLTGIYNRRYIDEKLPIEFVNAGFSDYSIGIIMADIDFFKNVNDTYGHLVGDYTLKCFADLIRSNLKRENDWVARFGGEEFIACLPGANLKIVANIAENMRKTIESTPIEMGEHKFYITASFGVSSLTPSHGCTLSELIDSADKKLYEAKHNGRNRVEA